MQSGRFWLIIAAALGGSGVAIGAYHAHGLEKSLVKQELPAAEIAKRMDNCSTAVRYQMYHALAIACVGLAARPDGNRRSPLFAPILWTAGTLGFSGGLFLIVFAGNSLHWSIVPLGGLLLICGWAALGISALAPTRAPLDPSTS